MMDANIVFIVGAILTSFIFVYGTYKLSSE